MQKGSSVWIRELSGRQRKVDVNPGATVGSLRVAASTLLQFPLNRTVLIFAQKKLEDDLQTLTSYGIEHESAVFALLGFELPKYLQDKSCAHPFLLNGVAIGGDAYEHERAPSKAEKRGVDFVFFEQRIFRASNSEHVLHIVAKLRFRECLGPHLRIIQGNGETCKEYSNVTSLRARVEIADMVRHRHKLR